MKAHERIGAALTAVNDAGRPALVPFITAGYPEPTDFISTLKAIAEDGMTIQRSSFEALKKGVSLKWIFDQLDSAKDEISAPLVMMSYLNPLLAFGYDALAGPCGRGLWIHSAGSAVRGIGGDQGDARSQRVGSDSARYPGNAG
jgi:tryptophan synthase alpha subunit